MIKNAIVSFVIFMNVELVIGIFDEIDDVKIDFISRDGKGDAFYLYPCSKKNPSNILKRRYLCKNELRGVVHDCTCQCPVGTIAFPHVPTCSSLETEHSVHMTGSELRISPRYFNPLSTIELKIFNCSARDPSLLHLDHATPYGWRDFIDVDINTYLAHDETHHYPMSIVRIWSKNKSPLPGGELFRLQFTAPCLTLANHLESRGDFVYFLTTGYSPFPRSVMNSASEEGPSQIVPPSNSNQNLAVSFIGIVIIVLVVLFIFLGFAIVYLLKHFVCKEETPDQEEENVENPFRDYAPHTKDLPQIDINQNYAWKCERPLESRTTVAVYPNPRVLNEYARTPYLDEGAAVTTCEAPSHVYESLGAHQGPNAGAAEDLDDTIWEEDDEDHGRRDHGTAALDVACLRVPESRSRQDYLSWSGHNNLEKNRDHQSSYPRPILPPPRPPCEGISGRVSMVPPPLVSSSPALGDASVPVPAYLSAPSPATLPAPMAWSLSISNYSLSSNTVEPLSSDARHDEAAALAAALAAAVVPEENQIDAKREQRLYETPPCRQQRSNKLPNAIVARFKIQYKTEAKDAENMTQEVESLSTSNDDRKNHPRLASFSYSLASHHHPRVRLNSSASNENVFFGIRNSRNPSLATTLDRTGRTSILTHDDYSFSEGTRI